MIVLEYWTTIICLCSAKDQAQISCMLGKGSADWATASASASDFSLIESIFAILASEEWE